MEIGNWCQQMAFLKLYGFWPLHLYQDHVWHSAGEVRVKYSQVFVYNRLQWVSCCISNTWSCWVRSPGRVMKGDMWLCTALISWSTTNGFDPHPWFKTVYYLCHDFVSSLDIVSAIVLRWHAMCTHFSSKLYATNSQNRLHKTDITYLCLLVPLLISTLAVLLTVWIISLWFDHRVTLLVVAATTARVSL